MLRAHARSRLGEFKDVILPALDAHTFERAIYEVSARLAVSEVAEPGEGEEEMQQDV